MEKQASSEQPGVPTNQHFENWQHMRDALSDLNSPSVHACLHAFTEAETLQGADAVVCDECTRKSRLSSKSDKEKVCQPSTKRYLIATPPSSLTLHLKRFLQTRRGNTEKINQHVSFPLRLVLDPFCVPDLDSEAVSSAADVGDDAENSKYVYNLSGVAVHAGGLGGGHYTAYALHESQWFYASDTHVSPVPVSEVTASQAFLLFYHRVR
eukprot:TRINITY_DN1_c0_g2_i2.p1 TRINITY_DN1_c0_g2~~TRINITY_DN1_c0_g2_i2.p1  ORF type:complete len:233 (+),score=50.50 TRINITY_DN1_c0_g2_i2:72-701(+)